MLIPQAAQHRYLTKREISFCMLERSTQDDCSAMFVESTAAFCLRTSATNRRTSELERSRLDGQALFLAGSDLAQCVEVFLQEPLSAFIGPIQADT